MMDCKKALAEANGDFEQAIDILRKQGQKLANKRADREASEGYAFGHTSNGKAYITVLNCETDFVAKNEEFGAFANTLIDLAVNNGCTATEQILALPFESITVAEKIIEMTGKIGEKIEISHYEVINAEKVVTYIHSNGKLGVLVGMVNTSGADVEEAGKDVAMQIAAMNPVAVDKDGVDASMIEREIEIGKEQARAEGKPEEMLEKIAMGKLQKFYKESTLLSQQFVKDNSLSIAQYLNNVSKGLTVNAFKRISIG